MYLYPYKTFNFNYLLSLFSTFCSPVHRKSLRQFKMQIQEGGIVLCSYTTLRKVMDIFDNSNNNSKICGGD